MQCPIHHQMMFKVGSRYLCSACINAVPQGSTTLNHYHLLKNVPYYLRDVRWNGTISGITKTKNTHSFVRLLNKLVNFSVQDVNEEFINRKKTAKNVIWIKVSKELNFMAGDNKVQSVDFLSSFCNSRNLNGFGSLYYDFAQFALIENDELLEITEKLQKSGDVYCLNGYTEAQLRSHAKDWNARFISLFLNNAYPMEKYLIVVSDLSLEAYQRDFSYLKNLFAGRDIFELILE